MASRCQTLETEGIREIAEMAELADARGSGPRTRKGVEVRVLFSAPSFSKLLND